MTYWITKLAAWFFMGQLASPCFDEDGIDENRLNNCGETCCAMVIAWLRGVILNPDEVKDEMKGARYVGTSDLPDLVTYLARKAGIATTRLYPISLTGPESLTYYIWDYTRRGLPLIVLRYFDKPGSQYRHWAVIIGIDPTYIYTADPWTGDEQKYTYADFGNLYCWDLDYLLGIEETQTPAIAAAIASRAA